MKMAKVSLDFCHYNGHAFAFSFLSYPLYYPKLLPYTLSFSLSVLRGSNFLFNMIDADIEVKEGTSLPLTCNEVCPKNSNAENDKCIQLCSRRRFNMEYAFQPRKRCCAP